MNETARGKRHDFVKRQAAFPGSELFQSRLSAAVYLDEGK